MDKKIVLSASVIMLLVCIGIAGSQRQSVYAEGFSPAASATKGGDPGVTKHMTGTIVGIKRLSPRVLLLTLDNGMIVLINWDTKGDGLPTESLSLNFARIEFEYVEQDGNGRILVAKSAKVTPSTTASPTPTVIPIGCVDKINCLGTSGT